jgi:hypothetical protein
VYKRPHIFIVIFSLSDGCYLQLKMLKTSLSLFFLQAQPFSCFEFPRWQAVVAVSLIGVLVGLDPSLAATPEIAKPPLWLAAVLGSLMTWVAFGVVVGVLRWWLPRGGRWDKCGDLFNLVAASWLIADALGAGLTVLGVPPLLTLPLWLYLVYVGAKVILFSI